MTGHKDATGVGLTEWISVRWLLKLEVLSDFILAGETTMAEVADFILEAFLEVDGIAVGFVPEYNILSRLDGSNTSLPGR